MTFHGARQHVVQTVTQGEWFTYVDLKDTYFHIPITPPSHHRKFLRFAYLGHPWQFRVLPFELSLSTRVFTRCVAVALAPLLPFLDNRLVGARIGFSLPTGPEGKHRKELPQSTIFIGVALNTLTMNACPSSQRVDSIFHLLYCRDKSLPLVMFQRLLGKLMSISAVVPLGLLSLCPLQRWLDSFHLDARQHIHEKTRCHGGASLP